MLIKNAKTSGTMRKARLEGPYLLVTAVIFAIAVAVDPIPAPKKPAVITAAS